MRVLGQPFADTADEPAQMGAHLDAGGRLAGPQHDRDGTAALGVVDMDRQKAALVVMGVEQRELLMAVHDIAGVVDIENDGRGLAFVGRHPLIDERAGQADRILQRRRVLQPRQRRLRTQIAPAVRQPPASELESGIGPQTIEIVGIFVAAGRSRRCGRGSCRRSVWVMRGGSRRSGKQRANLFRDPKPTVGHREQHDAAIRGQSPAIESGCDLLAPTAGNENGRRLSSVMASVVFAR